jgi:sulfatase modifying factor 1
MADARLRIALTVGAAVAAGAVFVGVALIGRTGEAATAQAHDEAAARQCARDPAALAGEVFIPGGVYRMGSDVYYPEEGPAHDVEVAPFYMDRHEVTNAEFAAFVDATGYVTVAERDPDPAEHPDIDPAKLEPGSALFVAPNDPNPPEGEGADWWMFVPGASWKHPRGPGSSIEGLDDYPVVHIAYEDAQAYAQWRGRRLPTEAEWERAARGGREGEPFAWGTEVAPDGQWRANTWQGVFPVINSSKDGFIGAAPVGCFEASDYGLYDIIGNVWEWTSDAWQGDPRVGVMKGGSFLCADNYCGRYRPAARQPYERDFSSNHLGFRTVRDGGDDAG